MPNHVKNELIVSPVVAQFFCPVNEVGKRYADFNTAIPQPANIETDGCPGVERLDANMQHEDGTVCWYEWNCYSWNTKWNAYSCEEPTPTSGDMALIRFDTAWSAPHPVIEALAHKFPDEEILHRWADEDLGYNFGEVFYHNGNEVGTELPDEGSNEAREWSCQLHYGFSYKDFCEDW